MSVDTCQATHAVAKSSKSNTNLSVLLHRCAQLAGKNITLLSLSSGLTGLTLSFVAAAVEQVF